jgi:hypothetical protein
MDELPSIGDGTLIPEGRVPSLAIVPPFELIHQGLLETLTRGQGATMHGPSLERGKEALHHRIVPAVPASAHARDRLASGESLPVGPARVNRPLI